MAQVQGEEIYLSHSGQEVDDNIDEVVAARGSEDSLSAALAKKADNSTLADVIDIGAKNLLKNGETTRTISDVTFTVGSDGSVTLSGTATANITSFAFVVSQPCPIDTDTYILSGCPAGGAYNTYKMDILNGSTSGSVVVADYGTGAEFLWSSITSGTYTARIRIQSGTNCNGLKFYPMICRKSEYQVSTAYQPYAQTNLELTASKTTLADIFGSGQRLPDSVNLNDVLTAGMYNGANSTGNTASNMPVANGGFNFQLIVFVVNVHIMQIFKQMNTAGNPYFYTRRYYNGTWTDWYQFAGTTVSASLSMQGGETRGEPSEEPDDEEMR